MNSKPGNLKPGKLEPVGLLCALPRELGELRDRTRAREEYQGLEFLELELSGVRAVACVGGVGKVMAARAAALLLDRAPRGLLVVGVCGGLRKELVPGTFVHCERAVQRDLWGGSGRETRATASWRGAWRDAAPGVEGTFLTADRAVFSPLRSWGVTRGYRELCVVDMETAAAGAVASAADKPWAALRVVSDQPSFRDRGAFQRNYPEQAGKAANTLEKLLTRLPI